MVTRRFSLQLDDLTSLRRLSQAIDAWHGAMLAATKAVGPDHVIGIVVEGLSDGSAAVDVLAEFDSDDAANMFEADLTSVHRAVATGETGDLRPEFRGPAARLRKVTELDGGHGMVLGSPGEDILVEPERDSEHNIVPFRVQQRRSESIGVIRGRLQRLSSRDRLSGAIFDVVFDKPVRVYFDRGSADEIREMWDKEVEVTGLVRRDPSTGRPLSIRDVTQAILISPIADQNAWRAAYGVLTGQLPDEPSSEILRRFREDA